MSIEVYLANGLRYIKPYYTTRSIFVKGRWIGRPLIDVLTDEFKTFTRNEYIHKISRGCYQLVRESKILDPLETQIKSGDIVKSTQHRHEPPVKQWCDAEIDTDSKIAGMDIVFEDDEILVLDKPMGIPIHPTGQFYQNTMTEILQNHGKTALPCYRLDKVTSGLMIMAKTQKSASMIQSKISSREMNKFYLARVRGQFPNVSTLSEKLINELGPESSISDDLITIEDSPIYNIEPKRGFPAGLAPSRDAQTFFYPYKYIPETNQSIVICKPFTGRTHQIRIHLARLGYPIINDSLYCSDVSMYATRLRFVQEIKNWEASGLSKEQLQERFNDIITEFEIIKESKKNNFAESRRCGDCDAQLMSDPQNDQLELCLHAWKYYDNDNTISFETKLPQWAL